MNIRRQTNQPAGLFRASSKSSGRVLNVIAPGPLAGAERVVIAGTRALRDAGVDVHTCVIADDRVAEFATRFAEELDGAPVHIVRVGGAFDVRGIGAIGALIRALGAEVVHTHGFKALFYTIPHRHRITRFVATHHGETAHSTRVKLYESIARKAYRLVDRVIAVSETTARQLRAQGVPGHRILVVENFLTRDTQATSAPPLDSIELLFVGRISPEKGLDKLILALAQDSPTRASMRLTVVGDGPEREACEALTSELGLHEQVRFEGFQSDVERFFASSHIMVMASEREGLPLVLVESLCSARPVLAPAVGGIPDVALRHPGTWLVPDNEVSTLSQALDDLPDRLPQLAADANENLARVRSAFSPRRWADDMNRLYFH